MLGEAMYSLCGYWVKESAEMDILLLFENNGYYAGGKCQKSSIVFKEGGSSFFNNTI